MNLLQAIVLSVLQGISELFPVSSLGHAVILPKLLRWSIDETGKSWLAFLVALHIGTATALLIYFWEDWRSVLAAFIRSVQKGEIGDDQDQRLAWMVLLGTIPAGVVGSVLQSPLRSFFAKPVLAALFLIVNGAIMFAGEKLMQRQLDVSRTVGGKRLRAVAGRGGTYTHQFGTASVPIAEQTGGRFRDITELSWRDAAIVGFAQIGSLIPGISRSGITMVAGLAAGLTHEAAARYAFLLATPIIFAAGLIELPDLFTTQGRHILGYAIIGAFLAGIAAYASVRYLMRYFESGRLYPFAYYCVGAGVLSLILITANL
ncbi:MAG TPA: undecaprenyl-diphosphate phosphatase [Chloroflexota bacterium]|jgi:undecaprenyl-diphosphatase|nr:undecaprenyl-diphosphate phosphatase [Chloroflexota bacterium]